MVKCYDCNREMDKFYGVCKSCGRIYCSDCLRPRCPNCGGEFKRVPEINLGRVFNNVLKGGGSIEFYK